VRPEQNGNESRVGDTVDQKQYSILRLRHRPSRRRALARLAVVHLVKADCLRSSPASVAAQLPYGLCERPVGMPLEHELHRIIDLTLAALDFDPAGDEI
jgi:hypothetical protein